MAILILESPDVTANLLRGNEFLLGNVQQAFDDKGRLKGQKEIQLLEKCFSNFSKYARTFKELQTKGAAH